jgi:large subunit ribosomal protein L24
MHVRRGDTVEILTGEYAGSRGKVLVVLTKTNRVIVEGLNRVKRHVRPSKRNPRGGRIEKEAPLAISNVAPVDANGIPARVGYEVRDGKKVRVNRSRKSAGTLIPDPPKDW